jgi:hypothetical protein
MSSMAEPISTKPGPDNDHAASGTENRSASAGVWDGVGQDERSAVPLSRALLEAWDRLVDGDEIRARCWAARLEKSGPLGFLQLG